MSVSKAVRHLLFQIFFESIVQQIMLEVMGKWMIRCSDGASLLAEPFGCLLGMRDLKPAVPIMQP